MVHFSIFDHLMLFCSTFSLNFPGLMFLESRLVTGIQKYLTIHCEIYIFGTQNMEKGFPIWILLFDWQHCNSKNRNNDDNFQSLSLHFSTHDIS